MKQVKICKGPVCGARGSEKIKEKLDNYLQNDIDFDNIKTEFCSCCGNCEFAPTIEVNGNIFGDVTEDSVVDTIKNAPNDKKQINIEDNFLNDI